MTKSKGTAWIRLLGRIKRNTKKIEKVIKQEYKEEATTMEIKISCRETGMESSFSSDRSLVSIGSITGEIAVAVKNAVIEMMPTKICNMDMDRPITQDSVRKKGKNNPKIKTGPFFTYN